MLRLAIAWVDQFQLNSSSSSITVVPLNIASHIATMCKIYNRFVSEQQLEEEEQEGLLFSTDQDEPVFKESFQHVARFIFMNRDMFEKNYIFIFDVANDEIDSQNVSAFVAVNPTLEKQKAEKGAPIRGFFRYNPLWNDDLWKDPPPVDASNSGPLFFLSIAKCLLFNKTWQHYSVRLRDREKNSRAEHTLASKFALAFGSVLNFHQWYQHREDPFVSTESILFNGSREFVQLTLPRTFPLRCGENDVFQGPIYSFLFLINVCHSLSNKKMLWPTDFSKTSRKMGKYNLEIPEEYNLSSYWNEKISVAPDEEGSTNESNRQVYGNASRVIVQAVRLTIISLVDRIACTNAGMKNLQEQALYKRMLTPPKIGVIQPYDPMDFGTVIGDLTQLCRTWTPLVSTSRESAGKQNKLPAISTAQMDVFDMDNDGIPDDDFSRKQSQDLAPAKDVAEMDGVNGLTPQTDVNDVVNDDIPNDNMSTRKPFPTLAPGDRTNPVTRTNIVTPSTDLSIPDISVFVAPFVVDYNCGDTSEQAKLDIMWKIIRSVHEASLLGGMSIDNLKALIHQHLERAPDVVVEPRGDKDILFGSKGFRRRCTEYDKLVLTFVEEYQSSGRKWKETHEVLDKILRRLRDDGFRFLEEREDSGWLLMQYNTMRSKVQKKVLAIIERCKGNPTPVIESDSAPNHLGNKYILCGLSDSSRMHHGNVIYRQKVLEVADDYRKEMTGKEKTDFAGRIVDNLREEGYQFVTKSEGVYFELTPENAMKKVKHYLRDIRGRKRKRSDDSQVVYKKGTEEIGPEVEE